MNDQDVEILCGPQPHPDYHSVCMTCGGSLIEKDGTWVHASEDFEERHTSQSDKQVEAEKYLMRYVTEHPGDPANAAVNWATLQRYGITVPIARAAMWSLVARGELNYSWEGWLNIPGALGSAETDEASPDDHLSVSNKLRDDLRKIRDLANDLIMQLDADARRGR